MPGHRAAKSHNLPDQIGKRPDWHPQIVVNWRAATLPVMQSG
jgi:hypothetical protein